MCEPSHPARPSRERALHPFAPAAMRPVAVLALISAIFASDPLPAQQDTSAAPSGASIRVPHRLGVFRLLRRQAYDDPALGPMFRYVSPDSQFVDVFLYPGPDLEEKCTVECAAGVLQGELDEFTRSFGLMIERRYVDSISVARIDTLLPDSAAAWQLGRAMRLAVVRRGEPLRSDFILWYLPALRVKLRATYPDREHVPAQMKAFADSLVVAIMRESAAPPPPPPIVMSVTVAGAPGEQLSRIADAMRALGYQIADSLSNATRGQMRSTPRTEWAADDALAALGGTGGPGVRLHARVTARGDSTVVQVLAESPVRESVATMDEIRRLGLMAVMEVMAAFAKRE